MIQEKTKTTAVLIAVAAVESVLLMPHFARIAVTPSKKAEPQANKTHIRTSCIRMLHFSIG